MNKHIRIKIFSSPPHLLERSFLSFHYAPVSPLSSTIFPPPPPSLTQIRYRLIRNILGMENEPLSSMSTGPSPPSVERKLNFISLRPRNEDGNYGRIAVVDIPRIPPNRTQMSRERSRKIALLLSKFSNGNSIGRFRPRWNFLPCFPEDRDRVRPGFDGFWHFHASKYYNPPILKLVVT